MSLLTSGVVKGMVGASLHMKSANVSMGVYRQEKAKGDKADKSIMARALGFGQDSMNRAKESSKQAEEALREAQKEARKQAKAEQEAAIEERRQEAAKEKKQEEKEKIEDVEQNVQKTAQGKKNQETVKETNDINITESSEKETNNQVLDHVESAQNVDTAVDNKKDVVTQGIYTAQGEIKSASVGHKLAVTV